jgi:hypothetical protein
MTHRLIRLVGSAALVAVISLPAVAQEYSNGGRGAAGRKAAILTPVEACGVHSPGIDPADAQRRCWRLRQRFVPYYAPLSPVASTARWRPWAYRPLLPYYTPYYVGYSPHRHFNPPPRPYGWDGWGPGPAPEAPLPDEPDTTPLDFGPYTSVVEDETSYWNMGGNGLVPYGALPDEERSADLIDDIQASRPRGRVKTHIRRVVPSEESAGEQEPTHRRARAAETIPPGEGSQDEEDEQETEEEARPESR